MDLKAASQEYLTWLMLEANRSPNTVQAYGGELRRLEAYLAQRNHSLQLEDLGHDDLRAYQRHLAEQGKSPASRARSLIAIRSWLRWLANEGLLQADLGSHITLPKLPQRLPKPIPADELTRLLEGLPDSSPIERRDRALVHFLISTGCRISEALALDRGDVPRLGNRVVVTGKGDKQRQVYMTEQARAAMEEYLQGRDDASPALFVNYDHSAKPGQGRRLTDEGARHIVTKLRRQLGVWSFKSPHVARHTAATNLLEVTGGDVRLVQEVLGHANLNTLAGYTKIIDQRKEEAYRLYERRLKRAEEEGG